MTVQRAACTAQHTLHMMSYSLVGREGQGSIQVAFIEHDEEEDWMSAIMKDKMVKLCKNKLGYAKVKLLFLCVQRWVKGLFLITFKVDGDESPVDGGYLG